LRGGELVAGDGEDVRVADDAAGEADDRADAPGDAEDGEGGEVVPEDYGAGFSREGFLPEGCVLWIVSLGA
jgi:hypothetical protein